MPLHVEQLVLKPIAAAGIAEFPVTPVVQSQQAVATVPVVVTKTVPLVQTVHIKTATEIVQVVQPVENPVPDVPVVPDNVIAPVEQL